MHAGGLHAAAGEGKVGINRIMVGNVLLSGILLTDHTERRAGIEAHIIDIVDYLALLLCTEAVEGAFLIGFERVGAGILHQRGNVLEAFVVGQDVEVASKHHGQTGGVHLPYLVVNQG